jgi:hypothetical protein
VSARHMSACAGMSVTGSCPAWMLAMQAVTVTVTVTFTVIGSAKQQSNPQGSQRLRGDQGRHQTPPKQRQRHEKQHPTGLQLPGGGAGMRKAIRHAALCNPHTLIVVSLIVFRSVCLTRRCRAGMREATLHAALGHCCASHPICLLAYPCAVFGG